MNKKINSSNKLAIKMVVALILGLAAGIGFIVLRENLMGMVISGQVLIIFYSKIYHKKEQQVLLVYFI